ncbi:hypothetical protein KL908_003778 [Ogataea polymorpha]|nr:hypothetical protein KL908_003778 [Ogataea polymorpha]
MAAAAGFRPSREKGAIEDTVGVHGARAAFERHPNDKVENCSDDQEENNDVIAAKKDICKKAAQKSARDGSNVDHSDKQIGLTRGKPVFNAHERKKRRCHQNRSFGKDTAQNAKQELAVVSQRLEVERLGEIEYHSVLSGHLFCLHNSSFLDQENRDHKTHKRDQSQQSHRPSKSKTDIRLSQHGGDYKTAHTAAVTGESHGGGSFSDWKVLRNSTHEGR